MKRSLRLLAYLVMLAALGSCSLFDYSGMVVHKYALVYGVTTYTMNPNGPNLLYPANDASAVAATLIAHGYTVHSRWVDGGGNVWNDGGNTNQKVGSLIYSGGVVTGQGLGDPLAPSKSNIISDIQSLSSTLGSNDLLLVYFSGHGTQDTSVSPPHEYFDPYGSVIDDGTGTFYDHPAFSVRDDELKAVFATFRTPRKVLILDTCNSGGFIGNQLEVDWTPPASANSTPFVSPGTLIQAISNYFSMQSSSTGLSPYGAQVMSGAGRDESDYEAGAPYDHGIMTYFLLQGLGGPADLNHDGHITVLEAFAYAKAGIDQNWNPANPGFAFEPHISGGPIDFVLF